MLSDEPDFMAYGPGNRTVEVVQRIHEGKSPAILSLKALVSLGVPEGNAPRVQRAMRFLGLTNPEHELTENAIRLRKAASEEYQTILAELLRSAYAPIFESYDPATATDMDLHNAFKPYDPAGQRGQMIALFMALCREAGLASEGAEVRRRGRPSLGTRIRESNGRVNVKKATINKPATLLESERPADIRVKKLNDDESDEILFHPAIDAYLRAARRIIESENWTADARARVIQGFETQLDLFLPIIAKEKTG